MRLRKIKLSGFKTFVDATTIDLARDRTGIVGPNGCGKSNILDALLWVLGESSAKHLRGDNLVDVIFNGSSKRKPVGQASVELLFDNSARSLRGQYADYDEISLRRQINRDGVTSFFLNGVRCRRRDVVGLFLGTGLSPRSYAIIEQGTISRLIEAKPDELRVFVEEAAGISKYRQRRKEAANRMLHAQENIDRVVAIRTELDTQLERLSRQVKATKQYREYKTEERTLYAQWLALGWRVMQRENEQQLSVLRDQETAWEKIQAELRSLEAEQESQRQKVQVANQTLNEAQSLYYQTVSEVKRLEQNCQHQREKLSDWRDEHGTVDTQLQEVQEEHAEDVRQATALHEEIASLQPRLQTVRLDNDKAEQLLNDAESIWQNWQSEWDAWNRSESDLQQQKREVTTRIDFIRERQQELQQRHDSVQKELAQMLQHESATQLQKLSERRHILESTLSISKASLAEASKALVVGRKESEQCATELDTTRSSIQELRGHLQSLRVLQEAGVEDSQSEYAQWMQEHDIQTHKRLIELLDIESDWFTAFEIVAGNCLHYRLVADMHRCLPSLATAPVAIGMIAMNTSVVAESRWPRLIDKVRSEVSLPEWLSFVYVADSLEQAMNMRAELLAHESVITAQGIWLGSNWIFAGGIKEEDGALRREQTIQQLTEELQLQEEKLTTLEKQGQQATQQVVVAEQHREENLNGLQSIQTELTEVLGSISRLEANISRDALQEQQMKQELLQIENDLQQRETDLSQLQQRLARVSSEEARLKEEREKLSVLKENYGASLEEARAGWQNSHHQSSGVVLQYETLRSREQAMQQAVKRTEQQIQILQKRLTELDGWVADSQIQLPQMEKELSQWLEKQLAAETALKDAREHLQQTEQELDTLEQQRLTVDQKGRESQQELEQLRVVAGELRIRLETLCEQLAETEQSPEQVLQDLDSTADQQTWEKKLAHIRGCIDRLGPVNFAAVEEFENLTQRREYLESQCDDLNKALETLRSAINKIDQDTRQRFRETYEQINVNLGELFTKLFGGGKAYLQLTSDDLLETGVSVMVQPPGKRNSNIQMLSGGEKALTAVALVFAIFRLNPAPFCILDEVDAPLDDANIQRFCELVRTMSADIQFVFITHNRLTMELAQKLVGVTMQEAGVSRLVAVDMDEALRVAANA